MSTEIAAVKDALAFDHSPDVITVPVKPSKNYQPDQAKATPRWYWVSARDLQKKPYTSTAIKRKDLESTDTTLVLMVTLLARSSMASG